MLVLRRGSVSRIPMVDRRTALGTVTIVSGEHPVHDSSDSNLNCPPYYILETNSDTFILISDIESIFYFIRMFPQILFLPVFSIDKRTNLFYSRLFSPTDVIWVLDIENIKFHKYWHRGK